MRIVDEFRSDLRTGRSIILVGAGVSLAASGNQKSTWDGLLRSGVGYANALKMMEDDVAEVCTGLLDAETTTAGDFLDVASELTRSLNAPESSQFADWLLRDVGYLQAQDSRILDAILDLNLPVVTTNYDDLLEKAGTRDHVTWLQSSQLQQVLAGQSDAIGHFHGYFREPRSVVLSKESYELLIQDQNIQALRKAMSAVNALVYVGFGAGLDDPNFGSLRRWVAETLPRQTLRHYRLCRDDEVDLLNETHAGESIHPVPYGPNHEDLAPFLEGLDTAGTLVQSFSPAQVLERIEAQARGSSVLSVHVPNDERNTLSELLIPPVVLPMAHEQYVAAARSKDPVARAERCNLSDEVSRSKLLLVGDENSGLSSALLWLVVQQHLNEPDLIPLVINYRNLGAGRTPLDTEVRKQLRQSGYAIGDRANLPPLALALDNVTLSSEKVLHRAVAELGSESFVHLIVGCRSGVEIDLHPLLNDVGLSFIQRHIGRLSRQDVRQLAALADSPRSKELAEKAIDVAKAQHLPTTPFTFSMIMSALLRGESLLAATSQTALLDSYVTLLMGWGRQDDDSRFGMDAFNRSFIVERLAELYVGRRRGSLPQEEVVAELTKRFEQLEWPDSPIETLIDLEQRRLLVIRGTEVAFAQSSYLHLFAAKRATRSKDFLEALRASPLYFAPIVQHYAALRRDDLELLAEMSRLLDSFAEEEEFLTGVFSFPSSSEEEQTVSKALGRFQDDVSAVASSDEDNPDLIPLDERADRDIEPFPLNPIEDGPTVSRMIHTLGLVSAVLRDTEIIEDLALRRRTLERLLLAWSNLVYALEHDRDFVEFTNEMITEIAEELAIPDRKREEFARGITEGIALSVGFGGLTATLSSRKLSVSLDSCMKDPEFTKHVGRAVMGAVLAFDVQQPGWSSYFKQVGRDFGRVPAVDRVLRRLAQQALIRQTLNDRDEQNLMDFLVEQALLDVGRTEPADMARMRSEIRQQLLGARMARKRASLPAGRSVLSATELDDSAE